MPSTLGGTCSGTALRREWRERDPRDRGRECEAVEPAHLLADALRERDVRAPGDGRDEREADADRRGAAVEVPCEEQHAAERERHPGEVDAAARADERDGERPEEVDRRSHAERQAGDGAEERGVHHGHDHAERDDVAPRGAAATPQARPGDAEQEPGGGDHPQAGRPEAPSRAKSVVASAVPSWMEHDAATTRSGAKGVGRRRPLRATPRVAAGAPPARSPARSTFAAAIRGCYASRRRPARIQRMTSSIEAAAPEPTLGVCVSGALGGVGRALVDALRDMPGFRLHSAVARREAAATSARRSAARRSASSSSTTSRPRSTPARTSLVDYRTRRVIRRASPRRSRAASPW